MKRIIRYVLVLAAVLTGIAVQAATPRSRYCFHHRHHNKGGVCLLSSYGFILEYANSSADTPAPFDNFSMMEIYMTYHNTLEPVPYLSAESIRKNQLEDEQKISKAINGYCGARRWSGYIQIENFHNWLKQNSDWCTDIDIVERRRDQSRDGSLFRRLSGYLEQNANPNAEYDYVALICFDTESSPHSVLLGYDGSYFMRDVNFSDKFADSTASFGFKPTDSDRLFEYLVFKVRRKDTAPTRWKSLNYSMLPGTPTGVNRYSKTVGNIKMKHLRFDHTSKNGPDGTIYYTGFILKSRSNPGLTVEVANYFDASFLRVNDQWRQLGMKVCGNVYEYDLEQLAPDLYIDLVHPNVDFSAFRYL